VIFTPTSLSGAYLIDAEPHTDARGLFARTWCREEFAALGLSTRVVQRSVSFNHTRGTLRGMHYQIAPFAETKLVRCTRGAVYDVIIDLRPDSPTFLQHAGVELTEENRRELYIPVGFAHGWQSLVDASEVEYQMSEAYSPAHARGVRWNDPAFGIVWPIGTPILHDRDASYPDFRVAALI
jgi:dTDP-4-dehydrorhamnose 3,5-epimerase